LIPALKARRKNPQALSPALALTTLPLHDSFGARRATRSRTSRRLAADARATAKVTAAKATEVTAAETPGVADVTASKGVHIAEASAVEG
jgi:hypothetical protein